MTRAEVHSIADRLVRPLVGDRSIETIEVREDDNGSGEPSLYIDVFIVSGARRPDTEAWTDLKLSLSRELLAKDERRFPYVRLRDREGEGDPSLAEAS